MNKIIIEIHGGNVVGVTVDKRNPVEYIVVDDDLYNVGDERWLSRSESKQVDDVEARLGEILSEYPCDHE